MPYNRTIAACVALSCLAHLMALMIASFVPWTARKAEGVMVVDLADIPRAADFFPPKPGIIEGRLPRPEKKAKPAARKPLSPRTMKGRVPDLPVNPALPPEESFPQVRLPSQIPAAAPAGKDGAQPAARAGEQTGAAGARAPSAESLGVPSLGKMVIAMGKTSGRGTGTASGNTVGSGGKAGEKGGIVEEGGGGARLTALNAPEIQYISYFAGIKRKIELVWNYPAGAAGIEGDVVADFVIGRNGKLESVTLVRGSGHRILDDEALGAIRKASPYAPIPSEYKIANLQIRAHFYYTVTATRILR